LSIPASASITFVAWRQRRSIRLDELASATVLNSGDLVIAEVLQGIPDETEFQLVQSRLTSLVVMNMGGVAVAVALARNYRKLRSLGITVRKSIDNLIPTFCILNGHDLLYSDRARQGALTHDERVRAQRWLAFERNEWPHTRK
jgi:hypothetical protein